MRRLMLAGALGLVAIGMGVLLSAQSTLPRSAAGSGGSSVANRRLLGGANGVVKNTRGSPLKDSWCS